MRRSIPIILTGLLLVLLSSCGHKGPLYLPKNTTPGKTTA